MKNLAHLEEDSSKKDDGGCAFPWAIPAAIPEHGPRGQLGMSLRDYFAAQAMNAFLLGYIPVAASNNDKTNLVAKVSYEVADAMIKQRDL